MHSHPIDVHGTADERLRRDGQRYTANRRVLIDALRAAERPVTVLELIDGTPGMAQSSAYRNLSVLEEAGVVRRLMTADDTARYELAEDLTGHHHHLICVRCGLVADFVVPSATERALNTTLSRAAKRSNFRITGHRLDALGLCNSCK